MTPPTNPPHYIRRRMVGMTNRPYQIVWSASNSTGNPGQRRKRSVTLDSTPHLEGQGENAQRVPNSTPDLKLKKIVRVLGIFFVETQENGAKARRMVKRRHANSPFVFCYSFNYIFLLLKNEFLFLINTTFSNFFLSHSIIFVN